MYDIVTLESDDKTVKLAYGHVIKGDRGVIPAPKGNFRFVVPGAVQVEGDGGSASAILVVVGHGSANKLSGAPNWKAYVDDVGAGSVNWNEKTAVYLLACSIAGEGGLAFGTGNFASGVKNAFPHATVWAPSTTVSAETLEGDWEKL